MFDAWGEKLSFFLRFIIYRCNDNLCVQKQGDVYYVVIGISDFGPKQGDVRYKSDGNLHFSA